LFQIRLSIKNTKGMNAMSFSAVPMLIIAFAVLFVLAGAWILLKQKWFMAWLKGMSGLLLIAFAVYISLFAFNLMSYHAMTSETPVATVSFRKVGSQEFAATVSEPDGHSTNFSLHGDLWQLDARIIKWKGIFELLGFKPGYRLDRIEGRYLTLADERSKPHSAFSIYPESIGFDIWKSAHDGFSLLVDARYGSATYLPMADGATYEVSLSNTGLLGRPLNDAARQAVNNW
jgi:hypothetical protein